MTTPPKPPLQNAQLSWKNRAPISEQFDDIYFSPADGLQETEYVFLKHNQLPERWQTLDEHAVFSIAETGFGTGLNFLCTAQHFLQSHPSAQLHFISYEKYPLHKEDLATALNIWPQLQTLSNELLSRYPHATPGFHRLSLADDRIHLTLALGDINQYLPQTRARVDAWFLDGFAPAKNPEMWTNTLFKHMARLSHDQTSFATVTAADIVKRGLKAQGFEIRKHSGYGRKREMLAGHYQQQKERAAYQLRDKPWFLYSQTVPKDKTAIVIGAGLAGCQSAHALAKRGYRVTLIERHPAVAQEASGNAAGVIYPKFSAHDSAQYRFYQQAYLHALQHIRIVLGQAEGVSWDDCGVLQLAHDASEAKLHKALIEQNHWPQQVFRSLSPEEASELAGTDIQHPSLYFPESGWVSPPALCKALIQHPNIQLQTETEAIELTRLENHQWQLNCVEKSVQAQTVIIANAADATQFGQSQSLPLKKIRGQVSLFELPDNTEISLNTVICHKGYITPQMGNTIPCGASFNLRDEETALRSSDHEYNIENLKHYLPQLAQELPLDDHKTEQGRVGFRCQTPDYLPIIGPVADEQRYKVSYKNLLTGLKYGELEIDNYHHGLFINVAHGSRGISNTGLGAEILASYINNEPSPVDQGVLEAVHPARFIIRSLKRQQ